MNVSRNYKDKDGNWQATEYLRDTDLLRTQKLLGQADDWIEQDKARNRSNTADKGR